MNSQHFEEPDIDDASTWTVVLSSPSCTDADRDAFERWLNQADGNAVAYARAQKTHALARDLMSDDLLMAELQRARKAGQLRSRPLRRWAPLGVAAALVLAVAIPAYKYFGDQGSEVVQRYASGVGEQRTFQMSDGTRVVLDTGSQLVASFDGAERRVDLLSGQAEFNVAEDPSRPFSVVSGGARIRDIGTTFQVRSIDQQLSVTLLDGSVSVQRENSKSPAITLVPGQRLSYGKDGAPVITAVSIDQADAWTQGALFAQEQRLDQLLLEMNRYSERKIRLANPADGAILISGRYKVNDQDALLKSLQAGWNLRPVSTSSEEVVLQQ